MGYGMGAYSIALARAGFQVVAVDQVPSTPFLQRLRDQAEPADRVEVVEGLIERHPIAGGLGVLVAKDVLHYLAPGDVEALLVQAAAASHPHGLHYLEVFTDISRTAANGGIQRIEGEADLSADSFRRLVERVYQGWHVSLAWDAHAEQDSRTGLNYFEALRATVVATRSTPTRKDAR
ncbi:class I SAM-dependent methyltransferase [Streptomyces microflavus]|uniref:class I SAM-dependent methyltransferase n=1 Tax=Streptomyces microflavus TaxID=1919 RepID=UPI003F4B8E54